MPLTKIIKDLMRGINTCESMPLHFHLERDIILHGHRLKEGRYNFIAHDILEDSFIYRNRDHKKVSISLGDLKILKKMKVIDVV